MFSAHLPLALRGALKLGLLFSSSLAVRVADTGDLEAVLAVEVDDASIWTFSGNPSQICGGPEIWDEIAGDGSMENALNIAWGRIDSLKEAYMDEQAATKKNTETSLKMLLEALAEAEKSEAFKETEHPQHMQLLEGAFGGDTFQDVAAAADWKCGRLRRRGKERGPRRGFDKSLARFTESSKAFFDKKEYRLDPDGFVKVCQDLLVKEGEADSETYCGKLCQDFVSVARSHSYAAVGESAGHSDKIKDKIQKAKQTLEEAKSNAEQCEVDWSGLAIFRAQLEELKAKYDVCHERLREAERALDELEWEMGDVSEELAEEEEKLQEAIDKLAEAGRAVEDGKAALSKAQSKNKELAGKVSGLTDELAGVRKELQKAETANDLMTKLKELVTNSMMIMSKFADAGLREPLYNLGFKQDPAELEALFPDPLATDAASVLKETVGSLHRYCEETATPAFETIHELIDLDLTPLCHFQKADLIYKDLAKQTTLRTRKMMKDLKEVVSWLNPWKANKKLSMEKAKAQEEQLVKDGQLAYLEQIKAVYAWRDSQKLFRYLIGWRKGGPHHRIILDLKAAIEVLQAKEAGLMKNLQDAQEAFEEAQKAQEEAQSALEKLQEGKALAEKEREALEEVVAQLKESAKKLNADIEEWRRRVEEARRALKEAGDQLLLAFTEGTKQGALLDLESLSDTDSEAEIEAFFAA